MGSSRHSTTSFSSASTKKDTPQLKWGPNLKRTREVPMMAGPWYCQLCKGPPLMTIGGMRKHYKSHYKLWDSATDTYIDMNEHERAHQELIKELRTQVPRVPSASATGAQPIQLAPNRTQFVGLRNEPSAAQGIPPPGYDFGSSSTSTSSESKSSAVKSRQKEAATAEPTLRIPTIPRRLSTGTRDRQLIIESPIKMTVPTKKNPIFAPPVDRCLEIEPESKPEDEDVVCIEDEPKPKIKNEFLAFEQVIRNPTENTFTQLLLFGVDATIQRTKRISFTLNIYMHQVGQVRFPRHHCIIESTAVSYSMVLICWIILYDIVDTFYFLRYGWHQYVRTCYQKSDQTEHRIFL